MKQSKLNRKTYQDWCIEILIQILKKKDSYACSLNDSCVKSVMKNIIAHYASHYYCENEKLRIKGSPYLNIWWSILKAKRWDYVFKSLLLSSEAKKEILKIKQNGNYDEAIDTLHLEHITPGNQIYKDLINLSFDEVNEDLVRKSLIHNRIVVLTKKETTNFLDGKGVKFDKTDVKKLKELFGNFCDINEVNEFVGKTAKDNGSALIRIARLMKNGVTFCRLDGNPVSNREIVDYLKGNFVIQ